MVVPTGWGVEPWDYPFLSWDDKVYSEGSLRDPLEVEGGGPVLAEQGQAQQPADTTRWPQLWRGHLLSTCWCGCWIVEVTWEQIRAYETEVCKHPRCSEIAAMSPEARLSKIPTTKSMLPRSLRNISSG